jgi:hypothetical protein
MGQRSRSCLLAFLSWPALSVIFLSNIVHPLILNSYRNHKITIEQLLQDRSHPSGSIPEYILPIPEHEPNPTTTNPCIYTRELRRLRIFISTADLLRLSPRIRDA